MRPFLLALLVGAAVGFQPGTAKCVHQLSASAPNAQTPCSPLLRHKNNDKRSPLSNFSKKKGALMLSSGGAQAESESPLKKLLSTNKPFIAASMLVVLDIFFRRLLESLAISFPSSLAGCGIMFATFLIAPGGDKLYQLLSPGAALLAKWLPVFFVPSLITLPLADSVGSVSEVL